MRRLRFTLAAGAVLVAAVLMAAATAGSAQTGFKTSQAAMLTCPTCSDVVPILTVGDTLPSGYRFEAIPDGIALKAGRHGQLDLWVNHETSTIPFPWTFPGSPSASVAANDFDNAQLSHLVLDGSTKSVLSGSYAISSSENFQRFCSNYLATKREGFDRPILFTNEETPDWVNRSGRAWPSTVGSSHAREGGVVVAYDPKSGKRAPMWGMGRHNHENSVAIPLPKSHKLVLLSGDDTFVSNPAQSQLYAYIADDTDSVLNDKGDLYAFVADRKSTYYDFGVNSTESVSGRFVRVPDFADDPAKSIAHGRKADGTDVLSSDFGYPAPPSDGTWQRDTFVPTPQPGIDGPQWVLEHWGDLNSVFQFVRIEDIAYDKRHGMGNTVYLADSGRAATSAGGNAFASSNGRIWKMVLDETDPTVVKSLSILVEGDDNPVAVTNPTAALNEIHQPDNLETTANGSLLVQEDPSGNNNYPPAGAPTTPARLWKVDLGAANPDASKVPVASVNHAADEGPTDKDPQTTPGALGSWESSGIVDASSVLGHGWFFVDVQAHTLWVEVHPGDDVFAPFDGQPDFTYKREGGQLLAIRIPGA